MYRETRVFIFAVTFSLCICVGLQAGTAYFGTLEEPVSTRVMGMGSAGTALGGGGLAFYNPAFLSLKSVPYVNMEFAKLASDLGRGFIETGWVFEKWFIGGAFQSQSIDFQYADEKGIKDAYGSEQGTMGSIATGFRKGMFSLGASVNGLHSRIGEYSIYGWSLSGGALYTLIPGKLDIGVAYLHGYGQNTHYSDTTNTFYHEQLPSTGRAGVAWNDSIGKFPYTVSADIVYSSNYETVMVPLGVELWLLPSFAVRAGKRINFDTDLFSMGVGVRWENMQFDAAFVPVRLVSDASIKWSMGLTYNLPSFARKKQATQEPETPQNTLITPAQSPSMSNVEQDSASVISGDSIGDIEVPLPPLDSAAVDTSSESIPQYQESLETADTAVVVDSTVDQGTGLEIINEADTATPQKPLINGVQTEATGAEIEALQEKRATSADSVSVRESDN